MWASILISQDLPYSLMMNKADTAEKENPPAKIIEREGSTNPPDANSGRGEKMPNVPSKVGDTPVGNIVPPQLFLQPRKIL
ncbi:hypothetical protein L3X38_041827 [Prunus dulcis]|uniref:Uncharacterized protein n=1 Tax=Prunus dulcis TaxID=3755 RepID=A0AAD4YL05_PRUDU|nr:hypothetical protein L3X38_041827 [Prunus dulcis]